MSRTPDERWRHVQRLCDIVDELVPSAQTARLRALEPDDDVRLEVMSLLRARREEATQQQVYEMASPAAAPAGMRLPEEIGGVRIQGFVGSGRSGDVYRGVRTVNGTPQAVAVRWYHARLANPGDLERLTSEQRKLATLMHPAIVRFLDAGVTRDGRPYLVMERADGQPITKYCDAYGLTVPERLRLLLTVCDAVASIHRRLIAHLDVNPSTIIVTDAGKVKLLDFGTAALADPSVGLLRTEPLTVEYASPERLRGEPVSVDCDVYSLGLVLCELAVGQLPFPAGASLVSIADRASGHATAVPVGRLLTNEAAARRGTTADGLRRALRGLDAIIAKATAWDPANRYPSVTELAADIRRYVDGEPVRAHLPRVLVTRPAMRKYAWPLLVVTVLVAAATTMAWRRAPKAVVADAEPARLVFANPARPVGVMATAADGFDAPLSMINTATEPGGIRMFDDFASPRGATIRTVTWRGTYCREAAGADPPRATAVAFRVAFHADANQRPDAARVLQSGVYPIERVAESLDRTFQAPCGAMLATHAAYRYAVRLDTAFVATAGTPYWLSIQAQVRDDPADRPSTRWGWSSGGPSNGRSIQLDVQDQATVLRLNRAFGLIE